MVQIVPLTRERLSDAITLLKLIFPYKPDQRLIKNSLTDSLAKCTYGEVYWVAVNETNAVIGITGLYDDKRDKNVSWLGWYGVHPAHRKHGTGSRLLKYAIDEAVKKDAAKLMLYTSSDTNEKAAHELYRKFGFSQIRVDRAADKIYFMKTLMEDAMSEYEIKIDWSGRYSLDEVKAMSDGGSEEDGWSGKDYGLYQIYGRHILYKTNTLLYIGIATQQTISERFRQHESWLADDQDDHDIAIYLGRVDDPLRYSQKDNWNSWEKDVKLAEKILIYKLS